MSSEPPTLQAVLDALRNFHQAFGGTLGPPFIASQQASQSGILLSVTGDEAVRRWQHALTLMIQRGVHPGPLSTAPMPPSDDTLDTVEGWLTARRRLPSSADLCPVHTFKLQEMVDYIRAMKAAQA